MIQNFTFEKPTRTGFIHAGAVTAELEAIPKDVLPPRGGWTFFAPANLGIQPGYKVRLKTGKPWFVRSVQSHGEGQVEVTLADAT